MTRLDAVRHLAQEVQRLDTSGLAGLTVRGLGTEHLYQTRLPGSPRWARLAALAEGTARAAPRPTVRVWIWRRPGRSRRPTSCALTTSAPICAPRRSRSGRGSVGRSSCCGDFTVALPLGADLAEEALSVTRGSTARRALGEVQQRVADGLITRDRAAADVVALVEELGLRPVEPPPLPRPVEADQLGVVCWMGVLPGLP